MNVRYFEDTVQFIQKVKFTGNDYFIEGFWSLGLVMMRAVYLRLKFLFNMGKKQKQI